MIETNETSDLWGDIVTNPIRTPLTILKEQGALLERKTNGILTIHIESNSNSTTFTHIVYLHSASLNYSYFLLGISHPIEIYPLILEYDSEKSRERIQASEETEFINILRQVFQSPKTQKVINALLSQSTVA